MGPASLWDIHLEEVAKTYDILPLSEPHTIARYEYNLIVKRTTTTLSRVARPTST